MKEIPTSLCEKNFLLESLSENKRVDGRNLFQRRDLAIYFGGEWGTCLVVSSGGSQILAQVSAHLTEPRATRPNEGILSIFVEQEEDSVELARLLERCLKESRCLDMESLCIVSEEKVWNIRLDIHVINNEGNVSDAASVAGLAALSHFRRPDVSLNGDQIIVHSLQERDPIKLSVHHHPVCSTFAFFKKPGSATEKIVIVDPSKSEEAVMNGKLVFGVNPYREICTLHLAGQTLIDKETVIKLGTRAAIYAKETVDKIKNALKKDEDDRKAGKEISLATALKTKSILSNSEQNPKELDISKLVVREEEKMEEEEEKETNVRTIVDDDVVEMIPEDDDEPEIIIPPKVSKKVTEIELDDDDSEEESTVKIDPKKELEGKTRNWYKPKW